MTAPPNPRRERRVIWAAGIVGTCMVLAVALVGVGGGSHDVHVPSVTAPVGGSARPLPADVRSTVESPAGGKSADTTHKHDDADDGGVADDEHARHPATETTRVTTSGSRRQRRVPPSPTAAADIADDDDEQGPARGSDASSVVAGAGRATLVTMSYPKSKRHHRLVEILRKILLEQYASPGFGDYVAEGVLVWNGEEDEIPAKVLEACKDIAAAAPVAGSNVPERHDWNEEDPGGAVQTVLNFGARLRVLVAKANSVDNRWRIGRLVRTAAALSLDDDINLEPEGAACLMDVRNAVAGAFTLVGIDVRSHCVHAQRSCKDHEYDKGTGKVVSGPPAGHGPYGYAARHILQPGTRKHFSVVLPRAIVVTRQTMLEYDRLWRLPKSGVRAVVKELECDDVALNFVSANASAASDPLLRAGGPWSQRRATAVYVKAKYKAYSESHDASAMVHRPGMKTKRQQCVNRLAAIFDSSARSAAAGKGGGAAAAAAAVEVERSQAEEDVVEDALAVDAGVPRHRTWFVNCAVDG